MVCAEDMELEKIWRKRYELAAHVEGGGLFAVPMANNSHALMVRQSRAKQAQAANAILMHRKHCSVCSHGHRALESQSIAS